METSICIPLRLELIWMDEHAFILALGQEGVKRREAVGAF